MYIEHFSGKTWTLCSRKKTFDTFPVEIKETTQL